MSDPKPTQLKFWLDLNDDDELTCTLCGQAHCDQSITKRGLGKTTIEGAHSKCVEAHHEKHLKVKRSDS